MSGILLRVLSQEKLSINVHELLLILPQASKYLLDPLTAPEPADETGPGTHFKSTVPNKSSSPPAKSAKTPSSIIYPTPPTSASPTRSSFSSNNPFAAPHRQAAFGDYNQKSSSGQDATGNGKGRRRHSSLSERFAGDMSHRPLDQLKKEAKAADRSPHLNRRHMPGADTIDSLDNTLFGGPYHHSGPYDATLMARNTSYKNSPVAATHYGNMEALKATPHEHIKDSLTKKVPLQGTAVIPPGMQGFDGKVMRYKEGADLMREADAPGGAYKRWDHVVSRTPLSSHNCSDSDIPQKYLPEDYKGKGEPSFSLERAIKKDDPRGHRRVFSDGDNSYEMTSNLRPGANRQRSVSNNNVPTTSKLSPNVSESVAHDSDIRRSNTTGRRVGEGLKRRFGSLRRSKRSD